MLNSCQTPNHSFALPLERFRESSLANYLPSDNDRSRDTQANGLSVVAFPCYSVRLIFKGHCIMRDFRLYDGCKRCEVIERASSGDSFKVMVTSRSFARGIALNIQHRRIY